MFVYHVIMYEAVHRILEQVDPVGSGRDRLALEIEELTRIERHAAERRLACIAELAEIDDGGVEPADAVRARTKCSRRSAEQATKTAAQLAKMPELRGALERGEISEAHADAAADAAARTSPEEVDAQLVGAAKARPADLFRRDSREWAGRKESDEDKVARHERQRRDRSASVFTVEGEMTILHARFDPVTGKAIEKAIDQEVDRLWRADGGRDGSPNEIRTPAQRRADAVENVMLRSGAAITRPHPKYLAVLRVDADRCRTDDPTGVAEFVDGTPIPQHVLERLACESAFVGAVYGADGAVLWQGREKRLATDEQWVALIERDGGCFCCGADPSHCEAHHLTPWEPIGTTDIDELLLVCTRTHHLVHDHGYRIEWDGRKWALRAPGEGRAPPGAAAA